MDKFEQIRIDPPLPAYIKKPEGDGPFSCVIVFMHRPGLDNFSEYVVDQLAKAGYVGVCHNSYRGELLRDSYTDESIFEDFEATLNYIKKQSYVKPDNIGIIGFCMGGRHAYLASSRYPELKAVVSYYGFPGQGTTDQNTPMKVVDSMTMPVLGIFGRQDHLIPFEDVEQFKPLVVNHSDKNKIIIYEDVGHGFLNPYSKKRHLDGVSAGKAWNETVAFYQTYLS